MFHLYDDIPTIVHIFSLEPGFILVEQLHSEYVLNDTNSLAHEKREHKNAQRRANYRKKKEQLIQDENLPPLTISGKIFYVPRLR